VCPQESIRIFDPYNIIGSNPEKVAGYGKKNEKNVAGSVVTPSLELGNSWIWGHFIMCIRLPGMRKMQG